MAAADEDKKQCPGTCIETATHDNWATTSEFQECLSFIHEHHFITPKTPRVRKDPQAAVFDISAQNVLTVKILQRESQKIEDPFRRPTTKASARLDSDQAGFEWQQTHVRIIMRASRLVLQLCKETHYFSRSAIQT